MIRHFLLTNIFVVPPLPVVTDLALIFDIWNNKVDPKSNRNRPVSRWLQLEKLGDTQLGLLANFELRKIFGLDNYALEKVLYDHAKSNALIDSVSRAYDLDKWLSRHPGLQNMADVFEVWIGPVVEERMMFDDRDPLDDLQWFLRRIWTIRYRDLHIYSTALPKIQNSPPKTRDLRPVLRDIIYPIDRLLSASITPSRDYSEKPIVGYLAQARLLTSGDKADNTLFAFGSSKEMVLSHLRTGLGKGPPLLFLVFAKSKSNCL